MDIKKFEADWDAIRAHLEDHPITATARFSIGATDPRNLFYDPITESVMSEHPTSFSGLFPPKLPNFIAVDTETTLNGNEEVGLAHPMHPDNKIVAVGWQADLPSVNHTKDLVLYESMFGQPAERYTPRVYCGHNFSFDLMYLYKTSPRLKEHFQRYKIWDTQLAEYLLTGQLSKFSSLDELSLKYGLPIKDDKIKKYFEAGIGADKIPEEELIPYLEQDVSNTRIIAQKQWQLALEAGQLPLIESQMEALHATTEMMFNGLHIDQKVLDDYTVEVVNEYVKVRLDLEEAVAGKVEDINSPKQWSTLFFGGKKKVEERVEVGVYKNGNAKYKNMERDIKIPALVKYIPDPDKVSEKTGQVSVDEAVLTDMQKHVKDPTALAIIEPLLRYRDMSKQLSTYVQGLSKHVLGEYIHGKLNHTATVTGRLSSTNPNLQNISNNPIKKIFTSRYEDGLIVEVDFSQLEVAALAHVTRDRQLIKDITSGVDIHSALYEGLYGRRPTKEERKPFKSLTFGLIYGAGPRMLSKNSGRTIDEAKAFIDVFYKRYPEVAKWHDSFSKQIDRDAIYLTDKDGLKEKSRTYKHIAETGRRFIFKEYYNESSWSDRMYSFSPTEAKNYPIQGLATGDIVPMVLGKLFRKLVGRQDVLLINTIHDSILFDMKSSIAAETILEILDVMNSAHEYFKETFGVPLQLRLKAVASYGTNWYEMEDSGV